MKFALQEIGEGVYEAELINWLVEPGQSVKRGQGLVEVMTDKATMEVPSPFVGTIEELRGEPGQKIKVGDVLLTYAAAGVPAAGVAVKSGTAAEPASSEAPVAIRNGNGAAGAHLPVKASP